MVEQAEPDGEDRAGRASRQVKVFAGGGGADFIIDITGYYR